MARRTRALFFVGLLSFVAACTHQHDGAEGHVHSDMPVDAAAVMGQPDRPIAGPQGGVGQFVVECPFSHALSDDPIVYPGDEDASHLHTFFGNVAADADSQLQDLLERPTTCEQQLDTASYWAPALLDEGELITPEKSVAYYRAGLGLDPTTVVAFPAGLMMIAGDHMATTPQPVSVVAWSCGAGGLREELPPVCPPTRGLRLDVTFPDCWDGKNIDVAGHRKHMYYSSDGKCPSSHPVPVPQLIFAVTYPVTGDASQLQLASGSLLTGHADFINAWDQEKLQQEVELCIHRNVVCGVTSGRSSG